MEMVVVSVGGERKGNIRGGRGRSRTASHSVLSVVLLLELEFDVGVSKSPSGAGRPNNFKTRIFLMQNEL